MLDEQFWKTLRSFKQPNVFNPWRDTDVHDMEQQGLAPERRVERLRQHFAGTAKYLLIGEAPGYRGCHFSGIPFTCEKQVVDRVVPRVEPNWRITVRELPYSEGSATIIWRTLHQMRIAEDTKLWNAFAWHPHVQDLPMSNRTPTPFEVHAAAPLLAAVVQEFRDARIVAVGAIAGKMLGALGVGHLTIRHPSMGGARHFVEGMERAVMP